MASSLPPAIRPIAFTMPSLRQLGEGRLDHFRRLKAGALRQLRIGDLLWVREPYYLPADFDRYKPTEARDLGAVPFFLDQLGYRAPGPGRFGERRPARDLCRAWHRRHLVVTAVEEQALQRISDADIAAMGHTSRAGFAQEWDLGVALRGGRCLWTHNPTVLRVGFRLVDEPVPDAGLTPAQKTLGAAARRKTPEGWRPSLAELDTRDAVCVPFGVTKEQLLCSSTVARLVLARNAAAWLLLDRFPSLSAKQVAKVLERSDANWTYNAVKRAAKLRSRDQHFRAITDALSRGERPPPYPDRASPTPAVDASIRPEQDTTSQRESRKPEEVYLRVPACAPPPRPQNLVLAPSTLQPPPGKTWCEQCEQLVDRARASACESRFCKVKPHERRAA